MSRPVSLLKLEEDAYYAVLRALAVNDLDWDKEKLLTDLRKILNITNDQHFKFLEEVTEDKLINRLREARSNPVEPQVLENNMPPPRQHPSNINRKSGRPSSGTLKITPSPNAGSRPRIAESASAELKRNRSLKRDRDEVFEPRRSLGVQSSSRGIKASLGGRGRGRGRRIPGIPRESLPGHTTQILTKKFKRIPFDPDHFRERLESGSHEELEEMNAALLLRSQAIQKHLDLIMQLGDEQLAQRDPLKHCHLLIQELEFAEIKLKSELESLKSDDEDSL